MTHTFLCSCNWAAIFTEDAVSSYRDCQYQMMLVHQIKSAGLWLTFVLLYTSLHYNLPTHTRVIDQTHYWPTPKLLTMHKCITSCWQEPCVHMQWVVYCTCCLLVCMWVHCAPLSLFYDSILFIHTTLMAFSSQQSPHLISFIPRLAYILEWCVHALTFSDFKYSNLLQIHLVAGENVPFSGWC